MNSMIQQLGLQKSPKVEVQNNEKFITSEIANKVEVHSMKSKMPSSKHLFTFESFFGSSKQGNTQPTSSKVSKQVSLASTTKTSENHFESIYPDEETKSSKHTSLTVVSPLSQRPVSSKQSSSSSKHLSLGSSSSNISVTGTHSAKSAPREIYKSSPTLHTRDSLEVMPTANSMTKNAFTNILDRLKSKDISFTEISFCNSKIVSQTENSYQVLSSQLHNNLNIVMIQFINVSMRDSECFLLMKALATCTSLEVLNIESNQLSSIGITTVVAMVEKHPSIRELRIANQSMGYCAESDRALANCLSQNTNITKFSHEFMETSIQLLCEKYIKRNMDTQNKTRASARSGVAFVMPALDPYPFPASTEPEKALRSGVCKTTQGNSTQIRSLVVYEEIDTVKSASTASTTSKAISTSFVPMKLKSSKSSDLSNKSNNNIEEENNKSLQKTTSKGSLQTTQTKSASADHSIDKIPSPDVDCIDDISLQFKSKYEMNMTKEEALRKESNSNTDVEHVRRQSVHFSKMGATFVNKKSLSSKSNKSNLFRRLGVEIPSNKTSISSKG